MKRDLDLIRKILQNIEEKETIEGYRGTPEIEGYLSEEISYHVRMMGEANLLKYHPYKGGYFIGGLTWSGHEFISLSKSTQIWEKTKKTALDKGIDLTIDLAVKLLTKFTQEQLNNLF